MKKILLIITLLTVHHAMRADGIDENGMDSTRIKDIEEVVIIHTPKETTKLRQMPTAVSLFGHNGLEDMHITSIKELSGYVPNFYMPDYGSGLTSAAYIRGVGSRINTPAVGLYVDNVAYTDKSAYDTDCMNIERIDVLRGPQGTLYGRNVMGGLIRIFTRNPFDYQGTDIHMGTSVKDNGYRISASHSQKVNASWAFSAGAFYKHSEGFFYNGTRHEKTGGKETAGGKIRLVGKPGRQRWTLDFSTDYSYREDHGYPYRYAGTAESEGNEPMPENIGRIIYNNPCFYRRSLLNSSLNAEYTGRSFILSTVTAYQNLNDNMTIDQDFTNMDFFSLTQKQRINSISEEVTIKSRFKARWEWVSGIYAMYQALHTKSPVTLTETFMNTVFERANNQLRPSGMRLNLAMHDPAFVADGAFDTPTADAALFHQSTVNDLFNVSGLSLTAGIRLEYEKMRLKHNYGGQIDYDLSLTSPMMPLKLEDLSDRSGFTGELSHDYLQWLPKVALQYQLDRRNNVYASWSKGYRSGGYNVQMFSDLVQGELQSRMMASVKAKTEEVLNGPMFNRMPEAVKKMITDKIPQETFAGTPAQTRYRPEYSYNYEVGGHFSLFGHRLQADIAAFYMDVHDQQISRFVGSGLGRAMVNAGKGRSTGMEISLQGAALDNCLTWNASYGYTHATFCRYEVQSADESQNQTAIDYKGNRVPFVPAHTMNAGVEYSRPVKGGKAVKRIFCGINTNGSGKIYWNEENTYRQPFYALLNAHAGADFGPVRIDVWGKNLTDTRYDTFFFTSSATTKELAFGQTGNPFQFGVDISLHF